MMAGMVAALRSLVPDTIVGRAVAILLVALALSHLLSMAWYQSYLSQQAELADERVAAERIAAVKQAVMALPPEERESAAHSLSGRGLTAHWSAIPLVEEATARDDRLDMLVRRLQQLVPGIGGNGLRDAYAAKGYGADHVLLVSTRLPDGSWINARATALSTLSKQDRHFIVPTTLMSLAILAVSIFLVRACTAEFRSIARAARRLGVDVTAPHLPVHGPEEVREAAIAFNEMQGRIRTLVTDRTQMLAAISHDLRSPITTIRLRAEFIEEGEERDRILAQLDEMEAMVSVFHHRSTAPHEHAATVTADETTDARDHDQAPCADEGLLGGGVCCSVAQCATMHGGLITDAVAVIVPRLAMTNLLPSPIIPKGIGSSPAQRPPRLII